MTLEKKPSADAVQWHPAERLGQMNMESNLRRWLIGKDLVTVRMKAVCGERFALRVVDQWSGQLGAEHKAALRCADGDALFRDAEMSASEQLWVFERTILPDSTLSVHPWLAELGDAALGETLGDLSGVERSFYEYAYLPAGEPVTARALRDAEEKPAGLWARRSRLTLRGAPLLIQELFLPAMGRA
jgi:chorismate--pyruvate lyase